MLSFTLPVSFSFRFFLPFALTRSWDALAFGIVIVPAEGTDATRTFAPLPLVPGDPAQAEAVVGDQRRADVEPVAGCLPKRTVGLSVLEVAEQSSIGVSHVGGGDRALGPR